MDRRNPLPLPFALALCLLAAAARAQSPGDCTGYGDIRGRSDVSLGVITGSAARIPFVKGTSDAEGCPNATDACRDRAYLVPGNRVIAGAIRDGFTCVDYVGQKGADRAGWVPAANVQREEPPRIWPADWIGTWAREEATIAIRPGRGDKLAVHGDATWGAEDPDRVKRGAVNIGEVAGEAVPNGADLSFAVGDNAATLPVDKGGGDTCKLWLRRLGPYLLADDNGMCGGTNVTFRGVYLRKP